MKKQIAALLSLILLTSIFTANASAAAEKFADVNPGAWYYTAVDYAVSEKLFNGTSATTFAPNAAMTRGMFVTVLGNKAGLDTKEYPSSSFSDVKVGQWYAPYVEWAAQNGIVTGTGKGRFSPEQSVTREQMAVILYNYAKFTDCDLTTRAGLLEQFPDGDRVSGYAKYAMEWAVTHKIISGSGGRLDPKGTATRAQVAQIFYSSRELLDNGGAGEPQPPAPSPSPSPSPSPDPDAPRIPITDEVRAKLKPNQDPEKILDYVLNGKNDDPTFSYDGTTAKWDPTLIGQTGVGIKALGSWENVEDEMRSSSAIANGFIKMLTRTASDRFYITAEDKDESMLNTAPDQQVEVTENGKIYPFFMDNEVVRGGVLIEKRDLESLLLTPLGGASLDGTLFEITNKSRNPVYVNGALYQPDEVCLTIEVKDGIARSDVRALPYGSYTLAESKPGTGYLWTDKTIRPFEVLEDGSVKEYREGEAAYNQVKRGDLKFVKVGEDTMHRFAKGLAF